jgi:antitoxin ParD1/3/4
MSIMLNREQEEWLQAKVAAGEFASLDQAVKSAVQRLIIDDELDDDDLDWAKPLVEEGLAQLERGESLTHEQVVERLQRIIEQCSDVVIPSSEPGDSFSFSPPSA